MEQSGGGTVSSLYVYHDCRRISISEFLPALVLMPVDPVSHCHGLHLLPSKTNHLELQARVFPPKKS